MVPLIKKLCCSLWGFLPVIMTAQTSLEKASLNQVTFVSPYYFGPNAFPIPDMSDGTTSKTLHVESYGDVYAGKRGDYTVDLSLKAIIPLWTNRANLSVWMPVREWYWNTEENISTCRVDDDYRIEAQNGHLAGDVYVSLEMQLFQQETSIFDGVIRSVLKTASGGGYHIARYYDCPGYYFDAALSKSFSVLSGEFRLGVSTGFLCWQTDNGRQNDAIMYGVMFKYKHNHIAASYVFGGYSGWENNIKDGGEFAHDCPMSHKFNFAWKFSRWDIFMYYQKGIRDYPFTQIRFGIARNFDLLSKH